MGLFLCPKEVKRCQRNQSARVLTPAVQGLRMVGSVRNTQKLKPNAMRSMTETLLYAVDMDGLGSVSVTAMFSSTRCVSVARSKAS